MELRITVEKLSNLEKERWIGDCLRLFSNVGDRRSKFGVIGSIGNQGILVVDSDIDIIGCDIFGRMGMIINWRDSKVNAVFFLIFLRNYREEFATRNFELLIIFYYRIISR